LESLALSSSLIVSWILLAQASTTGTTGTPWENLTALGILAVVIVWTITKTLPGMTDKHNETVQKVTEQFAATVKEAFEKIDSWQERVHQDSQQLNETLRAIAATSGTVISRGRKESGQ
jgi:gas vesicle protein